MLLIPCSHCGKEGLVPPEVLGKRLRCKQCNTPFIAAVVAEDKNTCEREVHEIIQSDKTVCDEPPSAHDQWYFQDGKRVQGPFPFSTLVDLVSVGRITPDTMIGTGNLGSWLPASTRSGLFAPDIDRDEFAGKESKAATSDGADKTASMRRGADNYSPLMVNEEININDRLAGSNQDIDANGGQLLPKKRHASRQIPTQGSTRRPASRSRLLSPSEVWGGIAGLIVVFVVIGFSVWIYQLSEDRRLAPQRAEKQRLLKEEEVKKLREEQRTRFAREEELRQLAEEKARREKELDDERRALEAARQAAARTEMELERQRQAAALREERERQERERQRQVEARREASRAAEIALSKYVKAEDATACENALKCFRIYGKLFVSKDWNRRTARLELVEEIAETTLLVAKKRTPSDNPTFRIIREIASDSVAGHLLLNPSDPPEQWKTLGDMWRDLPSK